MTDRDPPFLVVGHISRPHGTKGELFVLPLTDRDEEIFQPGREVRVSDAEGERPDPHFQALRVEASRPFRRGRLVFFDAVLGRNAAEFLRGRYLLIPFAEAAPLEEGDYYYHQLLGLDVRTVGGESIGTVSEVYELEPAHMLEVTGAERSLLVPFTRAIVAAVDLPGGHLVIDPPEGLLDL